MADVSRGEGGRSPERSMGSVDVLRLTSPRKKTVRHLEVAHNTEKEKMRIKNGELARFEASYANTYSSSGMHRRVYNDYLIERDVKDAFGAIKGLNRGLKANRQEIQTTATRWEVKRAQITREQLEAEWREDARLKQAEVAKSSGFARPQDPSYGQAGPSEGMRLSYPSYGQAEPSGHEQRFLQDVYGTAGVVDLSILALVSSLVSSNEETNEEH